MGVSGIRRNLRVSEVEVVLYECFAYGWFILEKQIQIDTSSNCREGQTAIFLKRKHNEDLHISWYIMCCSGAEAKIQYFTSVSAQTGAEVAILHPTKVCLILEVIEYLFYDYKSAKKFFEAKSVTSEAEMEEDETGKLLEDDIVLKKKYKKNQNPNTTIFLSNSF